MIERASEQVSKCDVTQADVHEFEVDHVTTGETYAVKLENKTYGCFRWELMGIPCYHALACIAMQRYNWEEYVHPAYHVATYARTYAPAFHPMPGKNQWPKTTLPEPMPPPFKKQPRIPKGKKRVKELGEGEDDHYVLKTKKQIFCKQCGQPGHYQKNL
ncbi:Protein MelA [Bienertia sinuspersici]